MTTDPDAEHRPPHSPEDTAVAAARSRLFRRMWAHAVEMHGRTWADGVSLRFDEAGASVIEHVDGASTALAELRHYVATMEESR